MVSKRILPRVAIHRMTSANSHETFANVTSMGFQALRNRQMKTLNQRLFRASTRRSWRTGGRKISNETLTSRHKRVYNEAQEPVPLRPDGKETHHVAGSWICRLRIGCARRLAAVRHLAGRAAGGGTRQLAARLPDGRPQAAHRDRPRAGRGHALLRLGGRR